MKHELNYKSKYHHEMQWCLSVSLTLTNMHPLHKAMVYFVDLLTEDPSFFPVWLNVDFPVITVCEDTYHCTEDIRSPPVNKHWETLFPELPWQSLSYHYHHASDSKNNMIEIQGSRSLGIDDSTLEACRGLGRRSYCTTRHQTSLLKLLSGQL